MNHEVRDDVAHDIQGSKVFGRVGYDSVAAELQYSQACWRLENEIPIKGETY